jgi:hypothetical protein
MREINMKIKGYEHEKETQETKEFVENLIYEHIKFMEGYGKLVLENKRLEKKMEDLERLNKYCTGSSLVIEGED